MDGAHGEGAVVREAPCFLRTDGCANTICCALERSMFDYEYHSTLGVMKAPPTESDEHIISNSTADAPDSDDGQDETQPHSPSRQGDFSEYLWMANEEEFEEQIMHELEEEALMQQCMEAMQEEMNSVGPMPGGIFSNGNNHTEDHLARGIQNLAVNDNSAAQVNYLNIIICFYQGQKQTYLC